ncbi:MAG TPA: IS481 family transposase [Gaiellaceae bacterium]|nr:IS481 family transposase [Gaiellaceae bacterium]
MLLHANAKLGLAGRYALVGAIEEGLSLRAAAAAFGVSPATAHRWWHRWLDGDRCRASLGDRSSRPRRSPRQLSALQEEPILTARRQTGYGPARLAWIVGRARSTIWKVLHRHGLSRLPRPPLAPPRRYEWSRPGALLHVDVKRLVRFEQPGHRVTGDRQRRSRRVGFDYLHCVVDDNSRYAYVELHPREDADTAARVLERALAHLAELDIEPGEAVMSDNALIYTRGDRFQATLAAHGLRHITTPPYTPRWNGKAERFIQTLQHEWAYVRVWPDSSSRARALQSFLRYYNRRRPHGSLDGHPPISRIHNVRGSYT